MAAELLKPDTVRLVVAMSADGYIDQSSETNWNSTEDWAHFLQMREWADAIVMGRTTYDVNHGRRKIDAEKPRIVLTHQPEYFISEARPGLEFTNDSPAQILDNLAHRGKSRVMIAGGATVYCAFLETGLVDELYVTKEPVKLKGDVKMPNDFTKGFLWLGHHQLNSKGTQVHTYVKTKQAVDA